MLNQLMSFFLKKRKIILIFVVILLIIILIFVSVDFKKEEQSEANITKKILSDDETYVCQSYASNNVSMCNLSPDKKENCKNAYYFYQAFYRNNNMCQLINDSRKLMCEAVMNENLTYCDDIKTTFDDDLSSKNLKNICKAYVRENCSLIKNPEIKSLCESKLKLKNIIKSKKRVKCKTLESKHDYLKCVSIIKKDPTFCVEGRVEYILTR